MDLSHSSSDTVTIEKKVRVAGVDSILSVTVVGKEVVDRSLMTMEGEEFTKDSPYFKIVAESITSDNITNPLWKYDNNN